jgi:hypothetical protein
MKPIRRKARQLARNIVERRKFVAKQLRRDKDPGAKKAMKDMRSDRKRIKNNYIQTRKDIKKYIKSKK